MTADGGLAGALMVEVAQRSIACAVGSHRAALAGLAGLRNDRGKAGRA